MQEISHFPGGISFWGKCYSYRLPVAVEGMAGAQAAGFAFATQEAQTLNAHAGNLLANPVRSSFMGKIRIGNSKCFRRPKQPEQGCAIRNFRKLPAHAIMASEGPIPNPLTRSAITFASKMANTENRRRPRRTRPSAFVVSRIPLISHVSTVTVSSPVIWHNSLCDKVAARTSISLLYLHALSI